MPSLDYFIISCEYSLKVTIYFENFVTHEDRPRICLPVYMVHKIDDRQIVENVKKVEIVKNVGNQEEEDIRRAIEESIREENERKKQNIRAQEDEDLRRAIEESKREQEEKNRRSNSFSLINNDEDSNILPPKSIFQSTIYNIHNLFLFC